jgi:hypothetical protein
MPYMMVSFEQISYHWEYLSRGKEMSMCSVKNIPGGGKGGKRAARCCWVLLVILTLVPALGWSQKIEITPMIGWELTGKANGENADLDFKDNVNYGVTLGYQFRPDGFVEFNYTRIDTEGNVRPPQPPKFVERFDVAMNYFLLGVTQQFLDGRFHPFVNGSLGVTWADPKESGWESVWLFTAALGGGAKIDLTKRLGARLQARLLMPMSFSGGGLWFGTGGAGVGVYSNVVWQGDFSAGLVIGLGEGP